MNKYPYTNYQDLNLDWVLGVAAEMRALTVPVNANAVDAYTQLRERGALAVMVYTVRGVSVLLRLCTYDMTGSDNPDLQFSGVYSDGAIDYVLYITMDSTGHITVEEKQIGYGGGVE